MAPAFSYPNFKGLLAPSPADALSCRAGRLPEESFFFFFSRTQPAFLSHALVAGIVLLFFSSSGNGPDGVKSTGSPGAVLPFFSERTLALPLPPSR